MCKGAGLVRAAQEVPLLDRTFSLGAGGFGLRGDRAVGNERLAGAGRHYVAERLQAMQDVSDETNLSQAGATGRRSRASERTSRRSTAWRRRPAR